MTQPDELKQAYDRSMAHNAMLREALELYAMPRIWASHQAASVGMHMDVKAKTYQEAAATKACNKALYATEADTEAWLAEYFKEIESENDVLHEQNLAMIDANDDLEQQLTTVTNERDALRELQVSVIRLSYCRKDNSKEYTEAVWVEIDKILLKLKTLTQKGGCSHSIVVDADYKGDGSPDVVPKEGGGSYTACSDYSYQSPLSE